MKMIHELVDVNQLLLPADLRRLLLETGLEVSALDGQWRMWMSS